MALRETSQTIATYLENQFKADVLLSSKFNGGGLVISLSTPREMVEQPAEGLSVWLYRVIRDEQSLNRPPPRVSPNELLPPPLPVRLYYLITPITNKKVGSPEPSSGSWGKCCKCFTATPPCPEDGNAERPTNYRHKEVKL